MPPGPPWDVHKVSTLLQSCICLLAPGHAWVRHRRLVTFLPPRQEGGAEQELQAPQAPQPAAALLTQPVGAQETELMEVTGVQAPQAPPEPDTAGAPESTPVWWPGLTPTPPLPFP